MKRLLAFLITLSMVFACLSGISLVTFAADDLVVGDQTLSYDGSGYVIDNADKFIAVFGSDNADTATTHAGDMVYHVTATIDLSNKAYTPNTAVFKGQLIGWDGTAEKKQIINLGSTTRNIVLRDGMTGVESTVSGLTGIITYNGNNSAYSTLNTGGVLNEIAGSAVVSHFIVKGNVTVTTPHAYYYLLSGKDAAVAANYAPSYAQISAFIGCSYSTYTKVSDIENNAILDVSGITFGSKSNHSINSTSGTGGIIGYNIGTVENCVNYADMTSACALGGVVGSSNTNASGLVKNCVNYGDITGASNVGGIVGCSYLNIEGCANFGNVTGASRIAGIAGYNSYAKRRIENSFNAGNITATNTSTNAGNGSAGGIVGYLYTSKATSRSVFIKNCYNLGEVKGLRQGCAIGDIGSSGVTETDDCTSTITGFYDLKNDDLDLYMTSYTTATPNVSVSEAYTLKNDGKDAIKALTSTINEESVFYGETNWKTDESAEYVYPTLVANDFDDNLEAGYMPGVMLGSSENPYKIATADDFQLIKDNPSACFKQVAHITDVTGASSIIGGTFTGTYDGGNYSITLELNPPSTNKYGGFFYQIDGGTVKNMVIKGKISSEANTSTGAITGYAKNAVIKNCTNEAIVSGSKVKVGGVIGYAEDSTSIENCKNIASVSSTNQAVAGIVAYAAKGVEISNCINEGAISSATTGSYACAGGIAGWISQSKVSNSHNKARVESTVAKENLGGIVGLAEYSRIEFCSNTGYIKNVASYPGGIAGRVSTIRTGYSEWDGVAVEGCFNAGTVETGTKYSAGLVGRYYSYGTGNNPLTTKNSFNAGTIIGEYASGLFGYTDVPADSATNTLKTLACYSTTGTRLFGRTTTNATYDSQECYLLGATGSNGITAENLIGLTSKSGSLYNDSTAWSASENGWDYPQIVGNIYDVVPSNKPYSLDIEYDNDSYILSWKSKGQADKYEVYVNDALVGETTEKSYNVTNAVKGKAVTIYVKAISAAEESDSEKLEFFDLFPGSGTEEDPYIIETAENFAAMEQVDAKGVVFSQTAEVIEIDDYYFKTSADSFKGTYNGNGNTIKVNIKVDEAISTAIGLFGYLSGTVNDLVITGNVEVSGATRAVGAIVGEVVSNSEAVMSKLVNKATIVGPATDSNTGGIVGRAYTTCTITDCINYGTLSGKKVGGITGCTSSKTVTKNCANFGDITGTHAATGIANNSYGSVSYCYNFGTITATGNGAVATGIAGNMTARIVKKDTVSPDGEIIGSTTTYTNPATVEYCFNAGQIVADMSCGIVSIITPSTTGDKADGENTIKTYNSAAAVSIKNCYNAVSAKYPVANYDDERIAEVLEKTGEALTHENVYYASPIAEDDNITGTTVVDKEGLKAITLDGFVTEGAYQYPQLAALDIPEEKADVDFILVTINGDLANGSAVEFAEFNSKALYLVKGKNVAVNVAPSFGYGVALTANGGDLGEFGAKDTVSVKLENADMVINAAEVELNPVAPSDNETSSKIDISAEPITIGETEYTRYALVVGRASQGTALKLKDFGILIAEEELTEEAFVEGTKGVRVAPAGEGKIEDGIYGILIYRNPTNANEKLLATGKTYYTRSYAIYEDKDGNTYQTLGSIQNFVMADPAMSEE